MTHRLRFAALFLTLLLSSTAQAEQKYFGLTAAQVADVGQCSGEATLGIASYMVYATKKPYAEALALSQKSNENSEPKLPAADIERRLKAVYDAKPASSANWASQNFEQCIVAKTIPVVRERINTCYISSFYMSIIIDVRKQGGDSKEKIGADMTANLTDPNQKQALLDLISYYYEQPAISQDAQSVLDIRHFLTCASDDQRPVSGSK